jgi:FkbM family methyltransferase
VFRLATSPIAPLLGQRLPVRAQARLINRSYLRMQRSADRAQRVLTTSAGDLFQADVGSLQEWHRWAYGSAEDQMAQLFSCLVRPGGRCLDVGAGIGLHTIRLAKLTGPAGEVIAIEPDPEMARRATRNIALNGLANARVIQAVASDGSAAAVADLTGTTGSVPTIIIDEVCPEPVALMKIHAGWHEAALMAGAATTIEQSRPVIIFEYVPQLLADDSQRAFGRLAEAGYLLYRIGSRRNCLTGRSSLWLDPLYARPETRGRLLAVSEDDAAGIISLVAFRGGRT